MNSEKRPEAIPRKRRFFDEEDHSAMRPGLFELIKDKPDLVACGEADNASWALRTSRRSSPAVLVRMTLTVVRMMETRLKRKEGMAS